MRGAIVVRDDWWARVHETESELAGRRAVRQTYSGDFDGAAQSIADSIDHDIIAKLMRQYSSAAFPVGLTKPWGAR